MTDPEQSYGQEHSGLSRGQNLHDDYGDDGDDNNRKLYYNQSRLRAKWMHHSVGITAHI